MKIRTAIELAGAVCVLMSAAFGFGASTVVGPGDVATLEATINAMNPGDEVVLQGGDYNLPAGFFQITVSGTAAMPVTIRAQNGAQPVLHGQPGQNIFNIDGAAHLVIRGLELTGATDGHGIRLDDANSVTIADCRIHDVYLSGVIAGTNGDTYDGLQVLRNEIWDTGAEGIRFGCNLDDCRVTNSVAANNLIHDSGTEIGSEGIEVKEGSHSNVVRDNVVHTTPGGWPCLLVASTLGVGDPNRVEGNVLWGCGGDGLFVVAHAEVWNNIILGTAVDGIKIQPFQNGTPESIEILHNTVLAPTGNAVRGMDFSGSLTIANNALYSNQGYAIRLTGTAPTPLTVTGNAGEGDLEGVAAGFDDSGTIAGDFVAASYSGAPPNDVYPASGGLLPKDDGLPPSGNGDASYLTEVDFQRANRFGIADIGAYRYTSGGAPIWTIHSDIKIFVIFSDGFESGNTTAW